MKYKREELIEKLIDDNLNADFDTIISQLREFLVHGYGELDNETLLAECDGRCITTDEDEIDG